MSIDRNAPMDPNWLEDAVRDFDEEMATKPPYTGYSPFRPATPTPEPDRRPE